MASREERLAANEARFREINEVAQPQREQRGAGRYICECADRSCMAWIEVDSEVYQRARANPRRFVVMPGHEAPDVETIVERYPGCFVIEKPESVEHVLRGADPAQ